MSWTGVECHSLISSVFSRENETAFEGAYDGKLEDDRLQCANVSFTVKKNLENKSMMP